MINLEAESTYDVFLSSGIDSCAFADSLYHCLKADGIRVFRDGELPLSVYSSRIYIPIFSVNYPFSTRCLDALELMVEHTSRSGGKKEILPVLYDVEWSDVNMEKKSLYGDALDSHRLWFGAEKVEKWEKALAEAGKVKGWERCSYKGERELITTIVGEISPKLKIEHNYAPEDLSTSAEALKIDIEHEDLFTGAEALKTDIEHEDLFTGAGPPKPT
ncbi:disease resistance protein RPV1-like [Syzygium oleosum]|uniref:disease resistance protein RPV1-like n=1 Tax=Syzygium oleosum TaxID=219896 RepID=UPI0024BAB70D|nr:disease resistance protein RPV1-like [Syzygium oleosum]